MNGEQLRVLAMTSSCLFAAVLLSGCAAESVEPLEPEFRVGDVMLEADLAQSRQNVLELCNTGDGAAEARQEWGDLGFQDRSGQGWIEALKYVGDLQYLSNPNAIVDFGSYTYPTAEALAEDCADAAFLLSQTPNDVFYPETAVPLLEAFRTDDGADLVIPLERIFNTLQE